MTHPLSTLKILDFSTLLPGPYASMMLADMGADVLHIEAPNRPDMIRFSPPFDGDTSAWHALLNRSKRSLALNLKKPKAVDIVKQLLQTYNIILEQFRPGVMDRLGIGYEALREINPALIYCTITGYGQTGPYKNRAGHDNNYLALAGIMSHTGRKTQGPVPLGIQVADIGGGSFGAITGILAAVIHRLHTGEGQLVDISMFDMAVAWNAPAASYYLIGNQNPTWEETWLNGGTFYDFYRTSDNRYLSVGSLEPKFWTGFCQAINRPDLINNGLNFDFETQKQIKTQIQQTISTKTLAQWIAIFANLDVCVEPVLTVEETLNHPHTQARNLLVQVPKPDGSTQPQIGCPIKFSNATPTYKHIGAKLGEHSLDVLKEIGYQETEIQALQKAGVFG